MAEKKMEINSKVFQFPINVASDGIITKTLLTADTYVDKNIQVTVETPDATFEVKQAAAVTATADIADNRFTSDTETAYAITLTADATAGAVKVGTLNPGFTKAEDVIEVEAADAEQDTKVVYIKSGEVKATGEATADSDNISLTSVGQTKPTSGFYVRAAAAGSAQVTTSGWVDAGDPIESSGDAYYTLPDVSFANSSTDADSYADIDAKAPVLVSGGYLFIDEGYIGKSKISLAKLVPDHGTLPIEDDKTSKWIYQGYSAYDNDGVLISGTMGDAKLGAISADDVAATISSVTVAKDGAGFKVTGSGNITGTATVAISDRGLAEATGEKALSQTNDITGTAAVNATLDKISIGIDVDGTDIEVTPVIAKEDSTTAKSGTITTSQPEAGTYFVAVSTAAIEASKEVKPVVSGEGYGVEGEDGCYATGTSVKGGAAASGTYYIPLTAGSHTAEAADPTIVKATATVAQTEEATDGFDGDLVAGILTTAPAGEYITLKADATAVKGSVSGTVTCTATEGYIKQGVETKSIAGDVDVTVTAAADKYIRVYDGSYLETL